MRIRSLVLATSALASLFLSVPTLAEQPSGGIEEIVVTAERRSQDVLSVPTSIQASTGEQLKNAGIHDVGDLELITPGLLAVASTGYTQLYIRGVGNSIFVGADPSVATYVDDVPRIWGQIADPFTDVERVEVLKGAQGGLYGRNATGGVINIVSRQPSTEEFYGSANFSYGEDNTIRAAAYTNMPLDETLAWSISAYHESHDPYIDNIAKSNPYSAADFSLPAATAAHIASELNADAFGFR